MTHSNQLHSILSEAYVKVTTPRTTFYGTPIFDCWVHTIDVSYTEWLQITQSGNVPKATTRRVYLTDEEYVMFKLQGFLFEPNRIWQAGHTYITG
jgi:hypothetical protein